MELWGEISDKFDSFNLNDVKNGVGTLFSAYTAREQRRGSSHQAAAQSQAQDRYTPEVESQNQGNPQSVVIQPQERALVGESESSGVNKTVMYVGGGVLALLLVGGLIIAVKD